MAPTVTLYRKSMVRGRGPQRIRAIVNIQFATATPGAYEALKGFLDAAGGEGIDIQSVINEPIKDIAVANAGYGVVGSAMGIVFSGADVFMPKMTLLASWTDFTHDLLGTHGILDFFKIESNNYVSAGPTPPYKRIYVRMYGVKAGPLFEEASTDDTITSGLLSVELEYTSCSGAEA